MIDFIPLDSYALVVNTSVLIAVLLASLLVLRHPHAVVEYPGIQNTLPRAIGNALLVVLCLLIGLRPISYAFGDMGNYYKDFLAYAAGGALEGRDPLFEGFMWLFAQANAATLFFLVCALIYLVPLRLASQRALGHYWPLAFLLLIGHISFYGFAVNGIRNGMAMSIFVLALTFRGWRAVLLMALAVGTHASLLLPVIAYALTYLRFSVRWALLFWCGCLMVSLLFPGIANVLATVIPADDRLVQYVALGDEYADQFSSAGFRWDFVIYSALPIVVALFFLLRKRKLDAAYLRLLKVYLLANAVWLLLIRVPFSNRFAYLSWGFMGLLLAIPFVKIRVFKQQQVVFAILLSAFFGFSYTMQL